MDEVTAIRIVDIPEHLTEKNLEQLIVIKACPTGRIQKVYLRQDEESRLIYAYIFFETAYQAENAARLVNGYTCYGHTLNVELIGAHLPFTKYSSSQSYPRPSIQYRNTVLNENIVRLRQQIRLSERQHTPTSENAFYALYRRPATLTTPIKNNNSNTSTSAQSVRQFTPTPRPATQTPKPAGSPPTAIKNNNGNTFTSAQSVGQFTPTPRPETPIRSSNSVVTLAAAQKTTTDVVSSARLAQIQSAKSIKSDPDLNTVLLPKPAHLISYSNTIAGNALGSQNMRTTAGLIASSVTGTSLETELSSSSRTSGGLVSQPASSASLRTVTSSNLSTQNVDINSRPRPSTPSLFTSSSVRDSLPSSVSRTSSLMTDLSSSSRTSGGLVSKPASSASSRTVTSSAQTVNANSRPRPSTPSLFTSSIRDGLPASASRISTNSLRTGSSNPTSGFKPVAFPKPAPRSRMVVDTSTSSTVFSSSATQQKVKPKSDDKCLLM